MFFSILRKAISRKGAKAQSINRALNNTSAAKGQETIPLGSCTQKEGAERRPGPLEVAAV
jgi:hypothetical protein